MSTPDSQPPTPEPEANRDAPHVWCWGCGIYHVGPAHQPYDETTNPPAAQQPVLPETDIMDATISDKDLLEALDSMSVRQDTWEWGDVLNARNAIRDHAVAFMQVELSTLTKTWEATQIELVETQAEVAREHEWWQDALTAGNKIAEERDAALEAVGELVDTGEQMLLHQPRNYEIAEFRAALARYRALVAEAKKKENHGTSSSVN